MVRPTFHFVENALAADASKLQAQKQNVTRRATAEATFEARGVGTKQISKPIMFAVTFAEEPHFVSGCATVVNANGKLYWDPIGHVGINQWKVNDKGQYVGAFLWVHVEAISKVTETQTLSDDTSAYTRSEAALALQKQLLAQAQNTKTLAKMRTMMYLTFTGRAIKDISAPSKTSAVTAHTVSSMNFATDD